MRFVICARISVLLKYAWTLILNCAHSANQNNRGCIFCINFLRKPKRLGNVILNCTLKAIRYKLKLFKKFIYSSQGTTTGVIGTSSFKQMEEAAEQCLYPQSIISLQDEQNVKRLQKSVSFFKKIQAI